MTTADVIRQWRKGAHDDLRVARLASGDGAHELALFHCPLAVEKALKAAIMEKTRKPHPKVHDLGQLALLVGGSWAGQDRELFDALSGFAVAARYDDPAWAGRHATAPNARAWIDRAADFLSRHCP